MNPRTRRPDARPLSDGPRSTPHPGLAAAAWFAVCLTVAVAPTEAQFFEVGNRLLAPFSAEGDLTGQALAIGDFDGDGIDDLAIGAPGVGETDSGAFRTYRGSRDRTLPSMGWFDFPFDGYVGRSLGAGDFDGDGRDELVVSKSGFHTGSVSILTWQSTRGAQWFESLELSTSDVQHAADYREFLIFTMAIGDYDNDGYDDVALGSPYSQSSWGGPRGRVHVFYGSPTGLTTSGTQSLSRSYNYDHFGIALAAGDFDGDGDDDLAIGIPGINDSWVARVGEIEIYRGSAAGLIETPQVLDEAAFGSTRDAEDRFGAALAAGDFDGTQCLFVTCYDDLAIGVPGQGYFGNYRAGKVMVAYGSSTGIGTSDVDTLFQGLGTEPADEFGAVLAAGRADRARSLFTANQVDLLVGVPSEDFEAGTEDHGMGYLFFGSPDGINGGQVPQTLWARPGLACAPATEGDRFGEVLALGDLDGDGWGDLVVGMPSKAPGGAVQVIYGALFSDGFESGGLTAW